MEAVQDIDEMVEVFFLSKRRLSLNLTFLLSWLTKLMVVFILPMKSIRPIWELVRLMLKWWLINLGLVTSFLGLISFNFVSKNPISTLTTKNTFQKCLIILSW